MRGADRILLTVGFFALVVCVGPVRAGSQSDLVAAIGQRLDGERASLVEFRHDLHRHPEVSGKEERTAGLVAERLRQVGFTVTTGVGGHGVVGVLRGGKPGPVVAYRADMDAVPSDAPDPAEFKSVVPGVRHICGHDVHTTIAVAMAEGFASIKDRLPGTVMLIFQPAEENATGAKAMLAAGMFETLKPAAIFAVHTAPFNVGSLVTTPGVLMAGRDGVRVTIERAPDPAATATAVRDRIMALATVTDQQAVAPTPIDFVYPWARVLEPKSASEPFVVEASISMASQEVRTRIHGTVDAAIAAMQNDDTVLKLEYEERNIAGVINDAALVTSASASVESVLGAGSVQPLPAVVPAFSEDFGSFQNLVPGVLFFLGVSNPEKGIIGMPHTPGYAADDEAIFVGARSMAAVLLDFLGSQPGA